MAEVEQVAQIAFCIRDKREMVFNVSRPLCDKCYSIWAKHRNKNYREKYCHSCGRGVDTTFARPLCSDCHKKLHSPPDSD